MDEQHERALFEAAYEAHCLKDGGADLERDRQGNYLNVSTADAWAMWLAARSQQSDVADAARVIEWAMDPNRKRANLAFTAGPERQAAYWIEWAQQQWRPISSAPDGECKHDWLRAWRDAKTGEAVPLWSCVYCNRRFEPVPAQPVEAPQREGGAG